METNLKVNKNVNVKREFANMKFWASNFQKESTKASKID